MTSRSKGQDIPRITLGDIAQCLRDELGSEIDISTDSHGELLAEIKNSFEHHQSLKDLKDVGFDLFEGIAEFDDAITSVEKVRPLYIEQEEQEAGRERIDLFLKDLKRERNRLLDEAKKSNPFAKMGVNSPDNWLTWRLVIYLRRKFPDRSIVYDYQVHDAVYSLLVLHGMEKRQDYPMSSEEQERTRKKIESRFKRFSEKINPHLRSDHISVRLYEQRRIGDKKQ